MDINKLKQLILVEHPNSELVKKLIECRYSSDILYMKLSDGQKIVYVIDEGRLSIFKENKIEFSESELRKAKRIMRELKLSTLINEGNS